MSDPHKSESTNAAHGDGMTRSSEEASVMEVEQRGHVNSACEGKQPSNGRKTHEQAKPFQISKFVVMEAYRKVKANRGAAGVDRESLADFEKDLKNNLYKIWNRMSSGTYFPPPVRMVEIPKKTGGTRALGIPTVSDRIAQMVVKMYLEPTIDPIFHKDSYGYRPGKSAIDAVGITRQRCWRYAYVLEFDIKGLFDNIDHELLMKAVRKHAKERWTVLYIERWLKASFQKSDGSIEVREKGTPQGGVISPLLANLFLHYAFDAWMQRNYPRLPFARYADDAVIHCRSRQEADRLKEALSKRLNDCHLELHPEKTRIVYCGINGKSGREEHRQFDFLGFSFRLRRAKRRDGSTFTNFLPAISKKAAKSARQRIRSWKIPRNTPLTLEEISKRYDPVLRGWISYYGSFYKSELYTLYRHMTRKLVLWALEKYKRFKKNYLRGLKWLDRVARKNPTLFVYWKLGYYPSGWN
jgi:RNA-directed DNA polymerase